VQYEARVERVPLILTLEVGQLGETLVTRYQLSKAYIIMA